MEVLGASLQRLDGYGGLAVISFEKQLKVCFARRADAPLGDPEAVFPYPKGRQLCGGRFGWFWAVLRHRTESWE